ncbi:MAG: PhoU domain-containing protein [Halobacteriales archaeon]
MDTRKVQQLGPSTLAMTLPADWARDHGVEKGDEVSLRPGGEGTLTVMAESAADEGTEAVLHADDLSAEGLERALLSQYVLGRRAIHVEREDGVLSSEQINAVYGAETKLMGLGVVEETPENISIRCSVDPDDFTLDNLLERLENTGSTMRNEAITGLARDNPDLAQRALNRERQANKIFILLLRLIFSAYRNPNVARDVGLESGFPLIGYRSITKNLELAADSAEDIADIVLDAADDDLDIDAGTMRDIREFSEQVDEIIELSVRAAVERDYDLAIEVRGLFHEIDDRERGMLVDLPETNKKDLLRIREVLVSLHQTAQYAIRNAEIAANLALDGECEHVSLR